MSFSKLHQVPYDDGKTSVVRKRKWLLRASLLRCGSLGMQRYLKPTELPQEYILIDILYIYIIYYVLIIHFDYSHEVDLANVSRFSTYMTVMTKDRWVPFISMKEPQSLYTEFEDGSWETRFSYVHELLGVGNLSGIRWCANHKGVVSIWRSVRFLN